MFDQIKESTDWICLADVPSSQTQLAEAFWSEAYSSAGVYLVAHRKDIGVIGSEVSNKDIGYVGYTTNNKYRVYSLRTTGHGCGRYIRQQGWSLNDVYIRFLYTDEADASSLEKDIFNENFKNFGKRFAWSAASSGNDGKTSQIEALVEKCNIDELGEVYDLIDNRLKTLLLQKYLADRC